MQFIGILPYEWFTMAASVLKSNDCIIHLLIVIWKYV